MATTKRSLFRSGLFIGIEAWRATFNASETDKNQIRQSYNARPASFHPPSVYVGTITERIITHPQLLRILTGQIVVVRGIYENAETMEWIERALDSLVIYVHDNPRLVSSESFLTVVGSESAELDLGGGTVYAAGLVNLSLNTAGRGA